MSSKIRDLANLPSLVDSAYSHLGALPRDTHLVQLLEQIWPECYTSEFNGAVIMAPGDAQRLEQLYELFGVPLKVAENSLTVLGRAYDVFCQGLGPFVSHKLMFPSEFGACGSFREYLHDWTQDWVSYVEAVAAQDLTSAREWAIRLQVLSPDCVYPAGTYIDRFLAESK